MAGNEVTDIFKSSNTSPAQPLLQTFKRRPRPAPEPIRPSPAAAVPPPSAGGDENAAKRVKRSFYTSKVQKQLTQSHLDLGQRNFHSTRCPTCGLVYSPGKEADDRLHATYHSKHAALPRFQPGHGDASVASDGNDGEIFRLDTSSRSKSLNELTCLLENELGLVPGWLMAVPGAAFLYVSRKNRSVLGCVVIESITEGWQAAPAEAEEEQRRQPCQGAVLVDKGTRIKAKHGVRMMWAAAQARRKKLATKLLDCARCQVVRGVVVPRHELAFSQPTPDGAAFIQSYTKSSEFIVYEAIG